MEELEILSLVAAVKDGDNAAFAELLSRYKPLISREISDFELPGFTEDELLSEAYFALHSATMTYDSEKHLTFGLYAKICIHNRLIDIARRLNTMMKCDAELDVERITVSPKIDTRLAAVEEFRSILGTSKSLLSGLEYKVLIYHVQGYKTAKIAKMLDISPKSVDNAKNRMFTKLRTHFGTK